MRRREPGRRPAAPPGPPDEPAELANGEDAAAAIIEGQRRALAPGWRRVDRTVVAATEVALFAVGIVFTAMIALEVTSRYLLGFSVFFVNAAAKLLLAWFFLLGAGIALRQGAHIGFELVLRSLSPARRRIVVLTGQALGVVFFVQMIWGGWHSLGPALGQTDSGLGLSLVWAFLSIPVGFALLLYHMLVLMVVELRRPVRGGDRR